MKQNLSQTPTPRLSVSAVAVVLLAISIGALSGENNVQAQKSGQTGNSNRETRAGQHKNLAPLKGTDSSDGSRVSVTSDGPLNDYSAYRSGDRYYVVIPGSDIPNARGGLHGRGYEDVQVHKRCE